VIAKEVNSAAMELARVYSANLIASFDACIISNSSFEERKSQ
jgi:hypothetical protein